MNTISNTTEAIEDRAHLLNLIEGKLERFRATPEPSIDLTQEAVSLLEVIERWAVDYDHRGDLVVRDPSRSIVSL